MVLFLVEEKRMSHQVIWSKLIVETFIEEANLNLDEQLILRTRVAGWPRTKQAMELDMSLSTVDRIIKRLKIKYDHAQAHSVILPPRKSSAAELFMDKVQD